MNKRTALVTGASGGIGRALLEHFAKDGCDLVLIARSGDKLEAIKKDLETRYSIQASVIAKDLSLEKSAREVFGELKRREIALDYLVNDAGYGLFGEFQETSLDAELKMIDLNIKALTAFTKLFLHDRADRREGGILNVASTAAFQPGPLMAVYYATKAYVLSFSEALRNELKGTGVSVTALCPGPTETSFSDRAHLQDSKLFKKGVMDAKTVAAIGYAGFKKGKAVVIPGFRNKLLAKMVPFVPREAVPSMVRKMQERES